MANWMNKHLFSRRQKKDHILDLAETKPNDMEPSEKKIMELSRSTEKLKLLTSQMNSDFNAFQQTHRNAEEEVRKLKKEIDENSSKIAFTSNKRREIDARIICLENGLMMERVHFELAVHHKNLFSAELLQLERKILEIKKITSSN